MIYWAVILSLVSLFVFVTYNSLITRKNQVENANASVEAMLKKRYDLLPNLVSTVKIYMQYEENLLTHITELRVKAISSGLNPTERNELDKEISKVTGSIFVAAENYPDLKANQNFLQLQGAWNEIEEQISAARRAYNTCVMMYNNSVQTFPSNFIANIFGFKLLHLFEATEQEKQNLNATDLFKK